MKIWINMDTYWRFRKKEAASRYYTDWLRNLIYKISEFQFRFLSKITPRTDLSPLLYWIVIIYTYLNITNCTFLSWFKDQKFSFFLRFRESLLALNQIDSLSISKFNISER